MIKEGAAFAHTRSKTTMCRLFRALFATVSTQQKEVFAYTYDNGGNMDPPLHFRVKSAIS